MNRIKALMLGSLAGLLERGSPDPDVWIFSSVENRYYNYNSRYLFEYVLEHCPQIRPVYILNDESKRRELADKVGITLMARLTLDGFSVYTHSERVL